MDKSRNKQGGRMKEYTIKQLMRKWDLSRAGVIKRIKRESLPVEKREVIIEKKQVIDIITLED